MTNISSLYPQYKLSVDRRQNNIPVAFERRSGRDRRSENRVVMDSKLTRDIYQVKEQVAKLEKFSPLFRGNEIQKQTSMFSQKNNITEDMFVRNSQKDTNEKARQEAQLKEKEETAIKIGLLAAAFAGVAAASFFGIAGAVIAVGSTLYIGTRLFLASVENEIKDDNISKM